MAINFHRVNGSPGKCLGEIYQNLQQQKRILFLPEEYPAGIARDRLGKNTLGIGIHRTLLEKNSLLQYSVRF